MRQKCGGNCGLWMSSLLRKPDILTSDEKVVPIQAQKSKFSKVRVGKMADTLVLKVESEGVFESDLRSV